MRKITPTVLAVLIASTLLVAGCKSEKPRQPEGNPEAENAAVECAEAWLALIDAGKLAESWDQAAQYLKAAVSRDGWEKACRAFRGPLGKMVSRTLKSKQYTTTAPGAPDGQYVIIQYDTSFQNKESAVEIITPMLDKDGKWRVSGYFIK